MRIRRVLVTGASGFTGRYVVPALKNAGFTPCVLHANLCDVDALKAEVLSLKPEAVLHLAGLSYVGHGNPADFYHVNLIGTLQLLKAVEAAGSIFGPVVLASSANIYGNIYQDESIEESFLPHPLNDYAVSKYAMEKMAALWRKRLPITIVRPFNYTGIGQSEDFVVPKIVAAFRQRKPVIHLGNTDVSRDFSDVRDIARWYVELLRKDISDEIINFCTGKTVSIVDIINYCAELCNYNIVICSDDKMKRKNELMSLCGSRLRLEQLLGDSATVRYGLRDTLQWMLL